MELVPAGLKGSAMVPLDRRAGLAANGTRLKEHICKNKKKRQPWATSEGSRDSDEGLLRTRRVSLKLENQAETSISKTPFMSSNSPTLL